jgi:hypothetical protein
MNILLISDDPERKSFGQIASLKKQMQGRGRNNVDLFIFSNKGIFLNQGKIGKKASLALTLLERLISEKKHDLIVVSLKLNNLKKLFPEKWNILDLIKRTSHKTDIFLFGAASVIDRLEKERKNRVFLYSRPGVSKLTSEFKNDLIAYIKTKQLG